MINRVLKLLKVIIQNKTKFVFEPPKPYKYLIFDKVGSENFTNILNLRDTYIIDTRFESLNLYIIGKCILDLDISLLNYFTNYVRRINPKFYFTN